MTDSPAPQNLLFILSDEHNRKLSGCYGHKLVQTPNIDALAARGTRFTDAYCNSPICVPSRGSLATGLYPHQIGCWDNATPYTGAVRSWHHMLRDAGVDVVSIGKLHYRGGDDYGFTEELIPLHVVDGKGDLKALFRKDPLPKGGTGDIAATAGPGDSSYGRYDHRIADTAAEWLKRRGADPKGRRFALFASFVMPHFPMIAPQADYDLYADYSLDQLREGLTSPPADHPSLNWMRTHKDYDSHFNDDRRAVALRAYMGMLTCLDRLIGQVLTALEDAGLTGSTRVIYTSDHGDNLGNRQTWGKSVMYEDSLGVPMIIAGQGVPEGRVSDTPVSLIDIAPTALAGTGVAGGDALPGDSLIALANTPRDRPVFAEYHAAGSDTGVFALRKGRWKYVEYVGAPPQLFDLAADPEEDRDLGTDPAQADVRSDLATALRRICDPEAVNAQAFADQAGVIAANGGRAVIAGVGDIPFTPAPD
uniref:sulfatase-like hydrolase/transferase n=1 Tax=Pararhizobium sp. IMCC3301 TaxID=3067904 RepID=UPI00274195D4|nr:sulfatase-like hydrolase/transferase [Pararhizobium sp. IMCC3301]